MFGFPKGSNSLSIINCQLSIINCQLSIVNCQLIYHFNHALAVHDDIHAAAG